MYLATESNETGITWSDGRSLENLNFANDLAVTATNFQDLQTKTTKIEENGRKIGLKINEPKTKTLRNNTHNERRIKVHNERRIKVGGKEVEDIDKFT